MPGWKIWYLTKFPVTFIKRKIKRSHFHLQANDAAHHLRLSRFRRIGGIESATPARANCILVRCRPAPVPLSRL